MVHTVVVAAVIIGMIAIVPYAMADHQKNFDDDDDDNKCQKRFHQAFEEFNKTGFIPAGIKHKVLDCLEEGFISPWELPDMGINPQQSTLTGLTIEFVESKTVIPIITGAQILETNPCNPGQIVFGDMKIENLDINVSSLQLFLQEDQTTLIVKFTNLDSKVGTLVLVTPCLGLISP